MRLFVGLLFLSSSGISNKLRSKLSDANLSAFDEDAAPSYEYVPTNKNTKAPVAFTDEVLPDERYHELVPALQVLQELTTTPAAKTTL